MNVISSCFMCFLQPLSPKCSCKPPYDDGSALVSHVWLQEVSPGRWQLQSTKTKKMVQVDLIQDAFQSPVQHALATQICFTTARNTQYTMAFCMELPRVSWKPKNGTITKRRWLHLEVHLTQDVSLSSFHTVLQSMSALPKHNIHNNKYLYAWSCQVSAGKL